MRKCRCCIKTVFQYSIFDLGSSNSTWIHQFYYSTSTQLSTPTVSIRLYNESRVGTPLRQYLVRHPCQDSKLGPQPRSRCQNDTRLRGYGEYGPTLRHALIMKNFITLFYSLIFNFWRIPRPGIAIRLNFTTRSKKNF